MEAPRPVKNSVLVRQDPPSDIVGKTVILFAPQISEQWSAFGTVLAVGPTAFERSAEAAAPGDRVMFKRQPDSALVPDTRDAIAYRARTGQEHPWKDLIMLDDENVIGIVDP